MPSAAGSDRSARPPSQSPLSSRTARAASTSSWTSASALARTSSAGQSGSLRPSRGRRRRDPGTAARDGSLAIIAMTASGIAGGSSRTSVAGRMPASGSAAAVIPPQLCPTIWRPGTSRPAARIQAATSWRCRGSGGGLASAGQAMTRQVRRDDPSPRRGQRRPDEDPSAPLWRAGREGNARSAARAPNRAHVPACPARGDRGRGGHERVPRRFGRGGRCRPWG